METNLEFPSEGNEVLIDYTVTSLDGQILDTTKNRCCFSFVLGNLNTYPEIENMLKTMKKGETKTIQLEDQTAKEFLKLYNQNDIDENNKISITVELKDFYKKIKSKFEMDINEKVSVSKKYKEEGVTFYKSQKFKEAFDKFQESLKYISKISDKDLNTEIKQLKLSLLVNSCNCCNRLKDYTETLKICKKVFELDDKNCKGYYYCGFANAYLDEFKEAEYNYNKLVEILKNDKDEGIIALKNIIEKRRSEKNIKEKNKMKSFLKQRLYED